LEQLPATLIFSLSQEERKQLFASREKVEADLAVALRLLLAAPAS
jgi:hypothetical protein